MGRVWFSLFIQEFIRNVQFDGIIVTLRKNHLTPSLRVGRCVSNYKNRKTRANCRDRCYHVFNNISREQCRIGRTDVYDIGRRSLMCKNSWKFQEYRYWKKLNMRLVKLSLAMPCTECFSEWMLSKRCYYTSYLSLASPEWQRKKKKETQRSSEVTEPLDDMRHANSFRRAENFGPRIQAARSRRPNANSSVKQWWYAGRGTRERRFYSRRLFLAGCMTFDWRREQSIIHRTRRSSRVHANANLGF